VTETRFSIFPESCKELSNILADHTLKLHDHIIHEATGYMIWMLQTEHFPPQSKECMSWQLKKDHSKFTGVRYSDTKKS